MPVQPNVVAQHPELGDLDKLKARRNKKRNKRKAKGIKETKTYNNFNEFYNDDNSFFSKPEKDLMKDIFGLDSEIETSKF
jgi:hypothetical protein